ncbi:MAG: hypothetical protein ACXVDA_24855, partial [Ktedonobacterales bacterium]
MALRAGARPRHAPSKDVDDPHADDGRRRRVLGAVAVLGHDLRLFGAAQLREFDLEPPELLLDRRHRPAGVSLDPLEQVRLALMPKVISMRRTRRLLDGRIKPAGIEFNVTDLHVGDFCTLPVYEQYDVAEMSFSWYVTALSRNSPVIALPVFPLRMAVFGYVFVRADSNICVPKDLIGKRIGTTAFRYTVNLWLRGIFNDHYGLAPDQ